MDVKNLMGKLQTQEGGDAKPVAPTPPVPPKKSAPVIEDHVQAQPAPTIQTQPKMNFGGNQMSDDGIILDLGEGISLNIPIQRRMSLSDFIKLAEKVKALEMLSESSDYRKTL